MLNKIISYSMLSCLFFYINLYSQIVMGPRLKVENYDYNFGKVKQGEILSCKIKLYNIGTEDLEIEDIKASCGCTDVELDKSTIPSGGEAVLTVKYNTAGAEGYQKKNIWIFSNDALEKELKLTLSVTVIDPDVENDSIPRLELSEYEKDFGDVKEGKIIDYELKIKNTGKRALIIKNIYPSCGCTVVDFKKKELKFGEEEKVKIRLDTKGFLGKIKKAVHILSNNKYQNVVSFYMYANVIK